MRSCIPVSLVLLAAHLTSAGTFQKPLPPPPFGVSYNRFIQAADAYHALLLAVNETPTPTDPNPAFTALANHYRIILGRGLDMNAEMSNASRKAVWDAANVYAQEVSGTGPYYEGRQTGLAAYAKKTVGIGHMRGPHRDKLIELLAKMKAIPWS